MKEKKKVIMEAAIRLFGKKGYDATSVQEIVKEAGISKGAFYIYYKSKEALLLAIFQHYYDVFRTEFEELKVQDLTPRELFVKQTAAQYKFILDQREFLIMQAMERVFNEEIGKVLNKMRNEIIQSHKESLSSIYGERMKPYIWDLTMLVQGLMHPYLELLIFDKIQIDLKELGRYILNRADNIAEGLLASNEKALLSEQTLMDMEIPFHSARLEKKDLILSIKEAIETHGNLKDIVITLEVLEEEISRKEPRVPVIEGMLANLKREKKLIELQQQIHDYFHLH
ncbi:TetR/AcrR family transcriptional regulator [Peribacillus sp. SCS-155]|uniref:TetR/AcrR family transcriptional regulator n=1 Tax=Peribacillus sedimenti TaxID=3115297 RepID=UPI0039068773